MEGHADCVVLAEGDSVPSAVGVEDGQDDSDAEAERDRVDVDDTVPVRDPVPDRLGDDETLGDLDPVLDRDDDDDAVIVRVTVLESVLRVLAVDVLLPLTDPVMLSVEDALEDADPLGDPDPLADADRDAESLGGGSVIVAVLDPVGDKESVAVDVVDEVHV